MKAIKALLAVAIMWAIGLLAVVLVAAEIAVWVGGALKLWGLM